MPVDSPKQSDRFAATLNSPPLTCTSKLVAFLNGTMPGSSRCTTAPSDTKSSSPFSGIFNPYFISFSFLLYNAIIQLCSRADYFNHRLRRFHGFFTTRNAKNAEFFCHRTAVFSMANNRFPLVCNLSRRAQTLCVRLVWVLVLLFGNETGPTVSGRIQLAGLNCANPYSPA